MSQAEDANQRVTDLEIKVAFLEKSLGELDAVVRGMSDDLDFLRREVAKIYAAQRNSETPPVEKPPHY